MKEDESDTEKTFEGETSDWIRRIDKGGLLKVNDDTYSSLLLSGVLHGAEDVQKLWERFMLARQNADLGWLSLAQPVPSYERRHVSQVLWGVSEAKLFTG